MPEGFSNLSWSLLDILRFTLGTKPLTIRHTIKRRSQTVQMVSSVALIAQQHLIGVSFLLADTASRIKDRLGPRDGLIQRLQVDEELRECGAAS